jgi:hypothetical protein
MKLVAGNLKQCFTVFQFLLNQACLRVCHILQLHYIVISYIIIHIIHRTMKCKAAKCAVYLGSIFIKTFYLPVLLNITLRVWPFIYVLRFINLIHIQGVPGGM